MTFWCRIFVKYISFDIYLVEPTENLTHTLFLSPIIFCDRLDSDESCGTFSLPHFLLFFFFFFPLRVNSNLTWVHCAGNKNNYLCTVHALKNIKNWSHGTIYTFKNYFAIVLLIFSFQFQQQ